MLPAALIAASPLCLAGSVGAAPLSSPLALKNADAALVETVQSRRRYGRRTSPGAGYAFVPRNYDYGYHAYGYGPRYVYGPVLRYRGNRYRGYNCTGEAEYDSAYPSWACPNTR